MPALETPSFDQRAQAQGQTAGPGQLLSCGGWQGREEGRHGQRAQVQGQAAEPAQLLAMEGEEGRHGQRTQEQGQAAAGQGLEQQNSQMPLLEHGQRHQALCDTTSGASLARQQVASCCTRFHVQGQASLLSPCHSCRPAAAKRRMGLQLAISAGLCTPCS